MQSRREERRNNEKCKYTYIYIYINIVLKLNKDYVLFFFIV